jgi:hypothetical protein
MSGLTLVRAHAKANQTKNSGAGEEVHENAPIECSPSVPEHDGEMRRKRKCINRVADKNRDQVFEPPPGSRTEELSRCRHGSLT